MSAMTPVTHRTVEYIITSSEWDDERGVPMQVQRVYTGTLTHQAADGTAVAVVGPDGLTRTRGQLRPTEHDRTEAGFTLCVQCNLHHHYLAEGECGTYMASLPGFTCGTEDDE